MERLQEIFIDTRPMKRSPPQAIVLWNKYLSYATALGVEKVS